VSPTWKNAPSAQSAGPQLLIGKVKMIEDAAQLTKPSAKLRAQSTLLKTG